MKRPRELVHERRARLIERAESEREDLARELGTWSGPLRNVERGIAVYRGIQRSLPVLGFGAGVGMAALAFVRPEGIGGWIRNATEIWRAVQPREGAGARSARLRRRREPAAPVAAAPAVAE
jgi:hypothetical protein